ncbi:hypothetical protein EC973_005138 [Apophysomyces ossiformis]|uniref:Uncharacterized protein n=1 Tax=Apophysomyces ossiformis TaxID=679940 RepID=A0A8H7EM45_9FUNG|nr:hypothetical protein EC973_005138 [Apophysomyces ossiformis]
MFEHNGQQYNYRDALRLVHPEGTPVAAQHNVRRTEVKFEFDRVNDAAGFCKDTLQGAAARPVFVPANSFVYPRNQKDLAPDCSENCIIL